LVHLHDVPADVDRAQKRDVALGFTRARHVGRVP
jgi:hypothetical protein